MNFDTALLSSAWERTASSPALCSAHRRHLVGMFLSSFLPQDYVFPIFLLHFHTAGIVCLRRVAQGMSVHAESTEPCVEGHSATRWVFLKARNAVQVTISQAAAFLDGLGRRRRRWPQDGSVSLHHAGGSPLLGRVCSESDFCVAPKQWQERDSLLKKPSLKKRTVGLNIRKQKTSTEKTEVPCINKSCNSFVSICSLGWN